MKYLILGAAGFIGTNLSLALAKNENNDITLVDSKREYFSVIDRMNLKNVSIHEEKIDENTDFEKMLQEQETVYHLYSTTVPSTSNQQIAKELIANVIVTANLLEACIKCGVKKIIFISSGGTVYGKEQECPLREETPTNPISSYGVQKITIEKLLYLYQYMYGLDYRIVRLANPYGPYQRPNGVLGAVTTFTYKAINHEKIIVYGDGSVVRDFIYIDDAIRAILNIETEAARHKTYNLGCGKGLSIKQLLYEIEQAFGMTLDIEYREGRRVDVPVNYLDISRYEDDFGPLSPITIKEGIRKTVGFWESERKR